MFVEKSIEPRATDQGAPAPLFSSSCPLHLRPPVLIRPTCALAPSGECRVDEGLAAAREHALGQLAATGTARSLRRRRSRRGASLPSAASRRRNRLRRRRLPCRSAERPTAGSRRAHRARRPARGRCAACRRSSARPQSRGRPRRRRRSRRRPAPGPQSSGAGHERRRQGFRQPNQGKIDRATARAGGIRHIAGCTALAEGAIRCGAPAGASGRGRIDADLLSPR